MKYLPTDAFLYVPSYAILPARSRYEIYIFLETLIEKRNVLYIIVAVSFVVLSIAAVDCRGDKHQMVQLGSKAMLGRLVRRSVFTTK